MSASVALARSNWRRHDIVYSPDLKLYGTIVNIGVGTEEATMTGPCALVEWQTGKRDWVSMFTLDNWQTINDERGKP